MENLLLWPGEEVIYQLADVALVKASERNRQLKQAQKKKSGGALVAGGSGSSPFAAVEDVSDDESASWTYGTLVITNRRMLLLSDGGESQVASEEKSTISVATRQIVLHGISTDSATFPKPCMYCQLDNADESDGDGDDFKGCSDNNNNNSGSDGDDGSEEGDGSDEENEVASEDIENDFEELYIVPRNEDKLSEMFDALSKSALANPDDEEEVGGEDGEDGDDSFDDDGHDDEFYEEFQEDAGVGGLITNFNEADLNEEQLRNLAHLESVFLVPDSLAAGNDEPSK